MGMRGRGFAFLFAVLLSACANQQQQIEAASGIKSNDDQFLPFRQYESGLMKEPRSPTSGDIDRFDVLLGRVDKKTGDASFAVQVLLAYAKDHRQKFQSARNAKAEKLRMIHVEDLRKSCSRSAGLCAFNEVFDVLIPETDLRGAGPEGYAIKLFARAGSEAVITIPKPVIASLLQQVDEDPARPTSSAAAR